MNKLKLFFIGLAVRVWFFLNQKKVEDRFVANLERTDGLRRQFEDEIEQVRARIAAERPTSGSVR